MNRPDRKSPGLYSALLLADLRDRLPRPVRVRWPINHICGAPGTAEEIVKSHDRLDRLLRSFPTNLPYSLDHL